MEKNPNILIVDNIDVNLSLLEIIPKPLNANLIMPQSGPEALKMVMNREIAPVFPDIPIPGISSIDTVSILQNDKNRSAVPIDFITIRASDEFDMRKYYEAGTADFSPNLSATKCPFV
jgi:CheY-like chemotaxis protein